MSFLRVQFILGLGPLLLCCDEEPLPPGDVGDACSYTAPCRAELFCVQGLCVATGDAGDCGFLEIACGDRCCPASFYCDEHDLCTDACVHAACGVRCCGEGEVCFDETCCTVERLCGDTCCSRGEVCEIDGCHLDCGDLVRCGEPETCCEDSAWCFNGECIVPTRSCDVRQSCDDSEYCDVQLGLCLPLVDIGECRQETEPIGRELNEMTLTLEWAEADVYMQPVVAQLSDDNEDGIVGDGDIPDIVFTAFEGSVYSAIGTLWAISGEDGRTVMTALGSELAPGSGLAVGDVDGDGLPEVAACGHSGGLYVFNHDGSLLWTVAEACQGVAVLDRWSYPAIADLEGDGVVEVVTNYTIVSGGEHRCSVAVEEGNTGVATVPIDIDGDGDLEVLGGGRAIDESCSVIWENGEVRDGHPAVADLDDDGLPEVVVGSDRVYILNAEDGSFRWAPRDVEGGPGVYSFASAIADFDGDGQPEFVLPGTDLLTLYDVDCLPGYRRGACLSGRIDMVVWVVPTDDGSCCAGPAAFDFDGDGLHEVVYADQRVLRIYRGDDGTVLYEDQRNSGTLWEYPIIADVNNDHHAEIVVPSENESRSGTQGIRVFTDAGGRWVSTRPIWNQYSYHVTNIETDGAVPLVPAMNWLDEELNNFRTNRPYVREELFVAPDLVISDVFVDDTRCPRLLTLVARVENQGSATAPARLPVRFYRELEGGADLLVATMYTETPLLPGEHVVVTAEFFIPDEGTEYIFKAVVDPLGTDNLVRECSESNNASAEFTGECELIG